MTAKNEPWRWRRGIFTAVALACALYWPFDMLARADEYKLAPDTKVQVSIVQWNPAKGEYQRWDALGGGFQVSQDGTIALPVIGSLRVSDKTSVEAAGEISIQLREKMGLISPPDVTVEIAQYPPIYVVGAVTTPGAYAFRPGLTALQALAIAGGRYRSPADKQRLDMISLRGELTTVRTDKLRLLGRIARLQAEIIGEAKIQFPAELVTEPDSKLVTGIVSLENTLFAARANETKRQLTSLVELRDMYTNEIQMLGAKSNDSSKEIAQTEQEVASLTKLVEQGIATVSRWSELRRVLAQMRALHSEDDIATMRARQNLSDTTRQEFGLRDKRQTEVATQLRDAQGDLARLNSREETLRRLLVDESTGGLRPGPEGSPALRFTVVRQGQDEATELSAAEATPLVPGDVLKVEVDAGLSTGVGLGAVSSIPQLDTAAAGDQ